MFTYGLFGNYSGLSNYADRRHRTFCENSATAPCYGDRCEEFPTVSWYKSVENINRKESSVNVLMNVKFGLYF